MRVRVDGSREHEETCAIDRLDDDIGGGGGGA